MDNVQFIAVLDILFKVGQFVVFVGGGAFAALKIGRLVERLETTMRLQSEDIKELKLETKKIGEVLTTIAIQKQQIEILERRMDELRHGEGFVFPLNRGVK